ncbi:MAG: LCP family protein [Clostridiales bacterium]|nr:LCP family protein [Candidatus Equinaster intestinalis]
MAKNKSYDFENDYDIYSSASHVKGRQSGRSVPAKKRKKKKKHTGRKIFVFLLVVAILLGAAYYGINYYVDNLLNENTNHNESYNKGNVSANTEVFDDSITNIALFGIDPRENTFKGRSDAIVILTVDKKRDKIKMTSIARDTYVNIEGKKKDKLTHAYAYGGAELAVKTLNQTFDLGIKDYVTVNFFGFAKIIDYVGGVDIDVDQKEKQVMNDNYISWINSYGIKCDYITKTGKQHLNGGQALAYSRNRYTGGDTARGTRQREVLSEVFDKVKEMGIGEIPELVRIGLKNSETSLSPDEIKELGSWALLNSPTIEDLSLPDDECNPKEGKAAYIGKPWYYQYDLDIATEKIHGFITEEGKYAEGQKKK